MSRPMYVPQLGKKLDCLFQRDPDITTLKALANALSIAPNNISIWIWGSETRAPDLVPNRHVPTICKLFDIIQSLLEIETADEFKMFLESRPLQRGPWESLAAQAIPTEAIELVRRDPQLRSLAYSDIEGDTALERFCVDECIYIKFTLEEGWLDPPHSTPHAVVLVVDRHKPVCLCPSKSAYAPTHVLSESTLSIPVSTSREYLKITEPKGVQAVFALITRQPLAKELYQALQDKNILPVLDRIGIALKKFDKADWTLLKKEYEVY